jgi:hypothetical protein
MYVCVMDRGPVPLSPAWANQNLPDCPDPATAFKFAVGCSTFVGFLIVVIIGIYVIARLSQRPQIMPHKIELAKAKAAEAKAELANPKYQPAPIDRLIALQEMAKDLDGRLKKIEGYFSGTDAFT